MGAGAFSSFDKLRMRIGFIQDAQNLIPHTEPVEA
jgi:hypothetical protein